MSLPNGFANGDRLMISQVGGGAAGLASIVGANGREILLRWERFLSASDLDSQPPKPLPPMEQVKLLSAAVRQVTEQRNAAMVAAHDSGETYAAIARAADMSHPGTMQIVKRLGSPKHSG